MIRHEIIEINSIDDFDKLKYAESDTPISKCDGSSGSEELLAAQSLEKTKNKKSDELLPIPSAYIDDKAVDMIKKLVGDKCDRVMVEFPYYEKDYLSTFYIYYAKKFKDYDKRSWRLTFFKDDSNNPGDSKIIGYTTLRPTTKGTRLGKTYIDPRFILEKKNNVSTHIILSDQKAHISNRSLFIKCFPWMSQQEDITVCAHIALWSLMRSLSSKTSIYAETALGKIAEQVEHYSEKIHSPGLTPQQIATILMKNGLATTTQQLEDYSMHYAEMISYVDSGFAFIGVLSKYNHAVSVIGYNINKSRFLDYEKNKEKIDTYIDNVSIKITDSGDIIHGNVKNNANIKIKIVLHSNFVESLVVNDDQCIPYQTVPMYRQNLIKDKNVKEDILKEKYVLYYIVNDIDHIVVPFYNRIHLSYKDAMAKFLALLASSDFKWTCSDSIDTIFVRGFLAHSNEYKEYISEWESDDVVLICSALEVPKYLWCFEISSRLNYIKNNVDSVVLMDSTASPNDSEPFLFIRDAFKCYYYDKASDGNTFKVRDYDYYEDIMHSIELDNNGVAFPCFKGGVERINNNEEK